jgi:hypothetical protein
VEVIVAIALPAALLVLALTQSFRGPREHAADQPSEDPAVTLSVRPGRRAVVTLDAKGDRSPVTAHLVDHAVRHAFTLQGIDAVEVRRADGELLERRRRPTLGWPAIAAPAAPPTAAGTP